MECPSCHSLSVKGRWYGPKNEEQGVRNFRKDLVTGKLTCPACLQQKQHCAQGVVELHGVRWTEKAELVFKTIDSTEGIARGRNDQERVLWTTTAKDVTKIFVTLPELARGIGRVLQRAFKGKVRYHRTREEPFIRVVWDSDEVLGVRVPTKRKSSKWRGRGVV